MAPPVGLPVDVVRPANTQRLRQPQRPDFLFDFGWWPMPSRSTSINIRKGTAPVSRQRMVNIAQVLGCPTLIVRYNPGAYAPTVEKLLSKHERRDVLERALARPPDFVSAVTVGAVYIFFDGHTPSDCARVHAIRQ